MKRAIRMTKSTSRRAVTLLLAIIMVAGSGILFDFFTIVANAAESNYIDENGSTLNTDYYYDKDDCDYTANSSTLHNEWSKFFNLSLVSEGNYSQSGYTYTASGGYPMRLKITGTPGYLSMHANGVNNGNDGMHHYSFDSNGKVNDYSVGSGLIIIEYLSSAGGVVSRQVVDKLWERDLSMPIDLFLKYHSNDYSVRVKLCYEVWKYQDGKPYYWNITQVSNTFKVLAKDIPYDKSFSPSITNYRYLTDDYTNTEKALEEPIYIKGVNKDTTDNAGIRLELYSKYLTINAAAGGVFYDKTEGTDLGIAASRHHWWYNLEKDSYIEINGVRSPLIANSSGFFVIEPPVPESSYINITLRANVKFHYTYYEHVFGIKTESANEEYKGYVQYSIRVPISVSDTNQVLIYDTASDSADYSQIPLVIDGMVKESNTIALVSSKYNTYTSVIQRYSGGSWETANSTESVVSSAVKTYTLHGDNPCEKYRVVLTDNQNNSRIVTFYVITDSENLLDLKLTNLQYNSIDNLPWVKDYTDHIITTAIPELYNESVVSIQLDTGGTKVTKKITIGNKSGENYIGNHYEFIYEYYVGEVDAPRLNSIKLQTNMYHIIPENYSVEMNGKVYAFRLREEALLFTESMIKDSYSRPTSLVDGMADKDKFNIHANVMIYKNSSRQELLDRASGNLEIIYVASYCQPPLDDKIYLYDSDHLVLSITDTVSMVCRYGNQEIIFNLDSEEEHREVYMNELSKELGYNEVQITEFFYDGTALSYRIYLQAN